MRRKTGKWVEVGAGALRHPAFVPFALPPRPALSLNKTDLRLLDQAQASLARLDGMSALLPDVSLFIYAWVRKEALTSAQIEGTQSSYSDLLLYESDLAPGVPLADVREVSDYVAAMELGLKRLRAGERWSVRLLCDLHRVLMRSGRGHSKSPGALRDISVWIGGLRAETARFVPPPPTQVAPCMRGLERFLRSKAAPQATLLRAALAHVQFETIHPFRDGNGRLGRLLITLMLCAEDTLTAPLLYLSLFLKGRRREYYDRLQAVRLDGDWEGWVRFFLEGVQATGAEATATARRTLLLFDADRRRITASDDAAPSMLHLFEALQRKPIRGIRDLERELHLTYPTVATGLERLARLGVVRELTGHRRNRLYAYADYLALLNEGTEPL